MIEIIHHWQTLITGILALIAAFGTILATIHSARIQTRAIGEATRQDIEATQKNARDTIDAMRTTTAAQVEAIIHQNQLLKATEQRKEARDKKALADTILPRISEIKRRAELNVHSKDSPVAEPLPGDKVQKTTKEVLGDLDAFLSFQDRIGALGLAASEAFFVLEKECELLKNGLNSGRQMSYSQFDPKMRELIANSARLIFILEAEIVRAKQILGKE